MKSSLQNRTRAAAATGLGLVLACGGLAGMACSGPEYPTPRWEPEGTILPPPVLAQTDTFECLKEGSEIVPLEGDAGPPPACCEGLTRAEAYKGSILRLDECQPEASGHAFCIRCGDGRCGAGENTCSCAADCHWP